MNVRHLLLPLFAIFFCYSAFGQSPPKNLYEPGDQQFTELPIQFIGVQYSSVGFGDYDNDGDLDILLTGQDDFSAPIFKIYRNTGEGSFEESGIENLAAVSQSSVIWGDYDNDGDLDILLTGLDENWNKISRVYRNKGNGQFEDSGISNLVGVEGSSVVWGDYDNDGDMDILLTGYDANWNKVSKIQTNENNAYTNKEENNIEGLMLVSVTWGDYDNDGDIDFLTTGYDENSTPITKIYRNRGNGTYEDSGIDNLQGVFESSVAWGDYNSDGYLDVLVTGFSDLGPITKIYRNNKDNSYTDINAEVLTGVYYGKCSWGDYDNDGDLDVLLIGYCDEGAISKIYRNDGGDKFSDSGIKIRGVYYGDVAWGDYDNDGDLDILISGKDAENNIVTKVYRNDLNTSNTPPLPPAGLKSEPEAQDVILTWNPGSDKETATPGLTYNLYLQKNRSVYRNVSPMADLKSGYREVVQLGNTNHSTKWTIRNLKPGKYTWSVQCIDNGFAGSEFAAQQSFRIQHYYTADERNHIETVYASSVCWGDDDNDGDLDIVVAGQNEKNQKVTAIYRNKNKGEFEKVTTLDLPSISYGDILWADDNNDGKLDLLVIGQDAEAKPVSNIYRNLGRGSYQKAQASAALENVAFGAAAWEDYNNDGFIDVLITGRNEDGLPVTKLYANDGEGGYELSDIDNLTGMWFGAVAFGDYDNDGDKDILLTGKTSTNTIVSLVYTNENGKSFKESGIKLEGVYGGSASWCDYDNDGDLDIAICGTTSSDSVITRIYNNMDGKSFVRSDIHNVIGVRNSSLVWGDYNNDGSMDILISGKNQYGAHVTKIYRNTGHNIFQDSNIDLPGVHYSSAAFGDADKDGDLDILLSGNTERTPITNVFTNNFAKANTPPTVPEGLQIAILDKDVKFSWEKANDKETPQPAITYNLYLKRASDNKEITSTSANSVTGQRMITKPGNVEHNNNWYISNLKPGKYFWSVQAIDGTYTPSTFAPVQSFEIK